MNTGALPPRCRAATRPASAFTLVEVALALGIAVFCLVALLGLLSVGQSSNRATFDQTTASNIARSIVADLRGTPPAVSPAPAPLPGASPTPIPGTTSIYGFVIPPAGGSNTLAAGQPNPLFFNETGSFTKTFSPGGAAPSQFRADVGFLPPPAPATAGAPPVPAAKAATKVRLLITWPAAANQRTGILPAKYSGSFEEIISLDRN